MDRAVFPALRAKGGASGAGGTSREGVERVAERRKAGQEGKAGAKSPAVEADAPRNYAPRGIAALIAPVTRPVMRKHAPGAAALADDWDGIVGPDLAAHSMPVKLAAGTLTIGASGPDALELQHRAPQLIARINLALGREQVVRLRFVQRQLAEPAPQGAGISAESVALPDNLPEGPVGEALGELYRALHRRLRRPR
jgi:hypothetical protein